MEKFKANSIYIIASLILIVLLGILFSFKSKVSSFKTFKEDAEVVRNLETAKQADEERALIKALDASAYNLGKTYVPGDRSFWTDNPERPLFKDSVFVKCLQQNGECKSLVPFSAKTCAFCGSEQGLDKAKEIDESELDDDGDGIPNGIEDKYPFLDRNKFADANQDYDRDYFTNRMEIEMGTDPGDPKDHPPYHLLLAVESVAIKSYGTRFVTVNDYRTDDKTKWEVQFKLFDNSNEETNRFLTIGSRFNNRGEEFEVKDISKKIEKVKVTAIDDVIEKPVFTVIITRHYQNAGEAASEDFELAVNEDLTASDKTLNLAFFRSAGLKRWSIQGTDSIKLDNTRGGTEVLTVNKVNNETIEFKSSIQDQPVTIKVGARPDILKYISKETKVAPKKTAPAGSTK